MARKRKCGTYDPEGVIDFLVPVVDQNRRRRQFSRENNRPAPVFSDWHFRILGGTVAPVVPIVPSYCTSAALS